MANTHSMTLTKLQLCSEREEANKLASKLFSVRADDEGNLNVIDQMISFSSTQPGRSAVLLREAGVLLTIVRLLNTHGGDSFSKEAMLASFKLLNEMIMSLGGAREFAGYGGHKCLMRLMATLGSDEPLVEALDELLADACGVASDAGVPFPTMTSEVLSEGEVSCGGLLEYDFPGEAERELSSTNPAELSSMTVLVQLLTVREQQKSQFTVGYLMWPAAVILGRWLRLHQELVRAKTVHEVGAGLGLSGLVACATAASTVLSDFNPRVVRNLKENIKINGRGGECSAFVLDWSALSECAPEGREPVDFVIGSDIVCQPSDSVSLASAVHALMKPTGLALIILPDPKNRFGTEAFPPALSALGLLWSAHPVVAPALLSGIDEASYHTWNAYLVWHPPSCEKVDDEAPFDKESCSGLSEPGNAPSSLPPSTWQKEVARTVYLMSLSGEYL